MCLFDIYISSLVKCLLRSTSHFFKPSCSCSNCWVLIFMFIQVMLAHIFFNQVIHKYCYSNQHFLEPSLVTYASVTVLATDSPSNYFYISKSYSYIGSFGFFSSQHYHLTSYIGRWGFSALSPSQFSPCIVSHIHSLLNSHSTI